MTRVIVVHLYSAPEAVFTAKVALWSCLIWMSEWVNHLEGCRTPLIYVIMMQYTGRVLSLKWHTVLCVERDVLTPLISDMTMMSPVWGRSTPLPPLSIYFLIFSPFYFFLSFLSFLGFTYFLLLSIPSLSTRIVPLRFQAGGRRRRPNLVLVCFFLCFTCVICIP